MPILMDDAPSSLSALTPVSLASSSHFSFMVTLTAAFQLLLLLLLPLATAETVEWRVSALLVDVNGTFRDWFGASVAVDNGMLAIGAHRNGIAESKAGAVFLYHSVTGGTWSLQEVVTASDAASPSDEFGYSVAISNGILAIGVHGNDKNGTNAGAVFLYKQEESGSWTEHAKLFASQGGAGHRFGHAVAMHGETLVVSAPFDETRGAQSGSVYVFIYQDESWTEVAKLIASDGGELENFGWSVAVQGDWLVVGSPFEGALESNPGSAYLFQRTADGLWTEQAKLTASDAEERFLFGWSVDILGDTVAVGSPSHNSTEWYGAVYLFVLISGAWTEQVKVVRSDIAQEDAFGWSLKLADQLLVVGAPYDGPGDAYLFSCTDDGSWSEQPSFIATGTASGDRFGRAVAFDNGTVVVGAPLGNGVKGAAYTYEAFPFSPDSSSNSPSIEPAPLPTPLPTALPTPLPTSPPTALSTLLRSNAPTQWPTHPPSEMTSTVPSKSPSREPTVLPTKTPTSMPFASSAGPSAVPSFKPSLITDVPTTVLSLHPTAKTTSMPTMVPTSMPTDTPLVPITNPPTSMPSNGSSIPGHCTRVVLDFEEYEVGEVPFELGYGVRVWGDGKRARSGVMTASTDLNKMLILPRERTVPPQSNELGGFIRFTFDPPIAQVVSVDLLDLQEGGSTITGKYANGRDFSVLVQDEETVLVEASHVDRLKINLAGSGGIDNLTLVYCEP